MAVLTKLLPAALPYANSLRRTIEILICFLDHSEKQKRQVPLMRAHLEQLGPLIGPVAPELASTGVR